MGLSPHRPEDRRSSVPERSGPGSSEHEKGSQDNNIKFFLARTNSASTSGAGASGFHPSREVKCGLVNLAAAKVDVARPI